ncbi:MAG: collagen-like protein [Longibaculum sp.]
MTGATGATGATDVVQCACVDQMRNVIRQIIAYYPNNNIIVTLESGDNVSGRPGALLPGPNTNPDAGLFELINGQGGTHTTVSLMHIASIRITGACYNNNITFLPTPIPTGEGCYEDCVNAIRSYLPFGTTGVHIKAGGQTVGQGTVIRNEYGMIVLIGNSGCEPTFVSLCKTEIITK